MESKNDQGYLTGLVFRGRPVRARYCKVIVKGKENNDNILHWSFKIDGEEAIALEVDFQQGGDYIYLYDGDNSGIRCLAGLSPNKYIVMHIRKVIEYLHYDDVELDPIGYKAPMEQIKKAYEGIKHVDKARRILDGTSVNNKMKNNGTSS